MTSEKILNFRTIIGFIISGILLWLTFYKSQLKLGDITIEENNWCFFWGGVFAAFFSIWLQSVRAKYIWISPRFPLRKVDTYSGLSIGNFYNCLLPGNLGEGMRVWHFSRKNKVSFTSSLSALFAEKWIDAQVFAMFSIVLLLFSSHRTHYILFTITIVTTTVFVLWALYIALQKSRYLKRKLWQLLNMFKKPGRTVYKVYWHTAAHINSMKKQGNLKHYLSYNGAIYFITVLQCYLLLKASGVAAPVLGLYSALFAALGMQVISFIPSAPSKVGVMHYGIYALLLLVAEQYQLTTDTVQLQSFALFAITLHLAYFIPDMVMGLVFIVKEKKIIF